MKGVVAVAVVIAPVFVALTACSPKSGVGLPCVTSENCPGNLACVEAACAEPASEALSPVGDEPVLKRPRLPGITPTEGEGEGPNITPGEGEGEGPVTPDEPEDPVEPIDPEPVEPTPGWSVVTFDRPLVDKPRIVPSATGVEMYFLEATASTCDGLTRAYPDGNVTELVAPFGGGCFKEMDAVRTGDGVVQVVLRTSFVDYSKVVFVTFGPNLLDDSAIEPETMDEHRGVRARVALTPDGDPDWLWSVRQASGPDLIEQLHLAETTPAVVLEVADLVDDLDYVVDSEGFAALFATIFRLGANDASIDRNLVLRTRSENIAVDPAHEVFGSIEATRCGGAMHVAYRRADEVVVARVSGTLVTARTVIASGLSATRARGDIAIACDSGSVWTAWSDAGAVHVAPPSGDVETVSAGSGGVALAVVDGVPHVAFGDIDPSGTTTLRQLRYATRP